MNTSGYNANKMKKKVGFTCGAFDILHVGHVRMLKEARENCEYLIVGIQSDPSIDRPQKNKPVQSFEERIEMVSSMKYVDEVVIYTTEESLYKLLQKLNPDVRIIGEDWKNKKYTGWDLPIKMHFNTRKHSFSTSELRNRIYQAELKRSQREHQSVLGR